MKAKKGIILLALACFCFLSALHGICCASPKAEAEAVIISKTDFQALKESNRKQGEALKESEVALKEAGKALNESNTALTEARKELNESKTQIAELKAALNGSESAENSIAKANEYLQNTRLEFQAREREHERTEAALRNKITAWQIVAALLGVGLAFS